MINDTIKGVKMIQNKFMCSAKHAAFCNDQRPLASTTSAKCYCCGANCHYAYSKMVTQASSNACWICKNSIKDNTYTLDADGQVNSKEAITLVQSEDHSGTLKVVLTTNKDFDKTIEELFENLNKNKDKIYEDDDNEDGDNGAYDFEDDDGSDEDLAAADGGNKRRTGRVASRCSGRVASLRSSSMETPRSNQVGARRRSNEENSCQERKLLCPVHFYCCITRKLLTIITYIQQTNVHT